MIRCDHEFTDRYRVKVQAEAPRGERKVIKPVTTEVCIRCGQLRVDLQELREVTKRG